MTDKVQKIREEVQRLQNELIQEKKKGFGSDIDDACILELQNVLTYIDSLQEEPKFKTGNKVIYLNEEYEIANITDHYILHRIRTAIDGRISVLHLDFDKEELMELVKESVSEDFEAASLNLKNYQKK